MTMLIQENFGGIAPKIDRHKLAPNLAQKAEHCLFEGGSLRPLRRFQDVAVPIGIVPKTVFPYQSSWISYTAAVDIAESPIPNDVHERLYIAPAWLYPQVRSGASTFRLGVPRPTAAPTVTGPTLPPLDDPGNLLEIEDIYYVVTWVDAFGAEGPPSTPSAKFTRVRDEPLVVTRPTTPTGNYNFGANAKWRLYRSNTGTSDTVFQFVADIALTTATFNDAVLNSQLQEELPSATWTGPPNDDTSLWPDGPLAGLKAGPNGIFAGYAKKTIYFCEPYLPHAWPVEYSITIRDQIVGMEWISSGLLVVTTGQPVIISGTHPASMTVYKPPGGWACTSKKTLVDMGGWAIYNSPDGLVGVDGTEFKLLTAEFFDNNSWIVKSSFVEAQAGNSEGRYVLFYNPDNTNYGSLIYDPAAGVNAVTTGGPETYSPLTYHDKASNILIVYDSNVGGLAAFDYSFFLAHQYTWRSKTYSFPAPVNFAYLEVVADAYPVTVQLFAGEQGYGGLSSIFNTTVAGRITPLPAGFEYDRLEIELRGTSTVSYVALYEDLTEAGGG